LSVVRVLGWVVTSIERTAYPRFKRLITAHELHLFFSPTREELEWAAEATDSDEHLLALLLMLKSYRRVGCFPALEDVPEMVVDFVRRAVELAEGTLPVYRAERTAKHHRGLVRKRVGVTYDQAKARGIVEQSIRKEAEAKNRPADLINIALEKVVEAGLELPGFSTFDKMASKIRTEVNASIRAGIHDRMSAAQRAGFMRLLEERDSDGTTLFNRLKKPAKGSPHSRTPTNTCLPSCPPTPTPPPAYPSCSPRRARTPPTRRERSRFAPGTPGTVIEIAAHPCAACRWPIGGAVPSRGEGPVGRPAGGPVAAGFRRRRRPRCDRTGRGSHPNPSRASAAPG